MRQGVAAAARAGALLLSALWAGALLAFALGAGLVLATAPSRAAGGEVNRALLDALDGAGFVLGALLLAAAAVLAADGDDEETPPRSRRLLVHLVLFALAVTAVSRLVVTPRMVALRDLMPVAMELVPKDDPTRAAWGRLHGISSLSLLARVGAALAVFALAYPRAARRRRVAGFTLDPGAPPAEGAG